MSGDVDEAPGSRLAGLLCRLANGRFTGVMYAEHAQAGAVFSFRDGKIVFVEDLGDAQSIADTLLEKQLLTQAQYTEIATSVVDSLAENEEVAFCEYAVRLGVLSQEQVDAELVRVVRGSVIQAVSWQNCRVEVDADPDSLTGILEYPQDVGPLVHIGVRTFFDEDRIRATIGREGELYARLLRAEPEIAVLLGLDDNETTLVSRIRPDVPLARVIDDSGLDSFEAWQVVCTLALAGVVELGSAPFSSAERSGVRATQAIAAAAGKYSSSNEMREERVRSPSQARTPAVGGAPARQPSQGRIVAAREEDGRSGSQSRINVAREQDGRSGSQSRINVAREQDGRSGSQSRFNAAREQDARQAARAKPTPPQAAARTASSSSTSTATAVRPDDRHASASTARLAQAGASPATAVPSTRVRQRPRKLSNALKRLNRDLKQFRPPAPGLTTTATPTVVESAPIAAPASYARARVEQLRQMRGATVHLAQSRKLATPESQAQELFRAAQEAMREQQFGRAHELMRKASEAEPGNQVYSMYNMWAAFRANALRQEDIAKLRTVLREKVSDDQHKAFAYYALGHISLGEKKDDAAEKFFLKAVELDKNNKDAERYVRIIAVRRKAATQEKANKIFGIELGPKKS